ncbi:unnamed protein product [Gulo gulo]|uniref:Uncharacterized protein n=1 Tax=Gulo gulo TaxID=48420 RepID=A0A9X9Q544_GULGU|nr:unnamed protein product [Gulo gulo]
MNEYRTDSLQCPTMRVLSEIREQERKTSLLITLDASVYSRGRNT